MQLRSSILPWWKDVDSLEYLELPFCFLSVSIDFYYLGGPTPKFSQGQLDESMIGGNGGAWFIIRDLNRGLVVADGSHLFDTLVPTIELRVA